MIQFNKLKRFLAQKSKSTLYNSIYIKTYCPQIHICCVIICRKLYDFLIPEDEMLVFLESIGGKASQNKDHLDSQLCLATTFNFNEDLSASRINRFMK